jgi:hypothetical protein
MESREMNRHREGKSQKGGGNIALAAAPENVRFRRSSNLLLVYRLVSEIRAQ